jgi:predicted dithiol-disulfide oxidoreductase (DUF899 family)
MIAISHAPLEKLQPFKKRMGWSFKWVSSFDSDFNYDFQVSFTPAEFKKGTVYYNYTDRGSDSLGLVDSKNAVNQETPGISVFYKDENGAVYHTYSCYARGLDMMNTAYISVFYKDENGAVYHTYSCYARGLDMMNTAYHYLDLVPKGRDEAVLDFTMAWVRYHDKYEKRIFIE